jgi:hypothetical protein
MATLETKFNRNDSVFFKYNGKIHGGVILSIEAHLGIFDSKWFVRYNLQTGMESGVDNVPEEHLFATSEEAEADKDWTNGAVRFIGY